MSQSGQRRSRSDLYGPRTRLNSSIRLRDKEKRSFWYSFPPFHRFPITPLFQPSTFRTERRVTWSKEAFWRVPSSMVSSFSFSRQLLMCSVINTAQTWIALTTFSRWPFEGVRLGVSGLERTWRRTHISLRVGGGINVADVHGRHRHLLAVSFWTPKSYHVLYKWKLTISIRGGDSSSYSTVFASL